MDDMATYTKSLFRVGAEVLIQGFDPPRAPHAGSDDDRSVSKFLDGATGVVTRFVDEGNGVRYFEVATNAAASGKLRCLPNEMRLKPADPAPKDMGFTGEQCPRCGSMKMVRAGKCSLCLDCQESNGCS